ncbi:nucleotide disphospho-sugar-binding domain-containing protein [Micromonospora auratinigra]|uniref:UDP:flavonoid glycosyltransferase YjiC, YdhE family n=1 Tax=Micromonospora auratinigra TaxID=261654 RepID=A0A1A8ZFY8_9ACTN|nr:nucleotide disphospho-sugar-binding domain-containing protein [Micromonospora auratinigra]SBT42753.1 UDP:flavonoid glycosyltransferase YjiC, YdhE family [Micromonospora auratinigra]
MRVLFTVSPWAGDWFCAVPLGWALQAAGHDVRVACTPGQAATVARAGLVPVPVLESPDLMRMSRTGHLMLSAAGRRALPGLPLPLHPWTDEPVTDLSEVDVPALALRLWEEISGPLARRFDATVELARAWRPELVVYGLMGTEGTLAARLLDVPAVYHSPGLIGAVEEDPALDMGPPDPTGAFARHGVAPWQPEHATYAIDPSPAAARPPHVAGGVRLPVRYVPYNGPGVTPDWARERGERPRLAVMWGSSAVGLWGPRVDALREAVLAGVDAGAEVVLVTTTAQAELLGELPERVRVLPDFPLRHLLDTADAVVHHGSVNGLMTAAAAGLPQLSLALADEQIAVARRMLPTGAVLLTPGHVTPAEEIRAAVGRVLDDGALRRAAAELGAELAALPSPAALVGDLEKLAA